MIMETIYENNYGATLLLEDAPNPNCKIQLVVDSIGIFMSERDIAHLLNIVAGTGQPCNCLDCGGNPCNKIWCSNPSIDICLKVEGEKLDLLEDLLKGTQFILNMDATLAKYRVKPNQRDA